MRSMSAAPHARLRGFGLIELMVVISIIAILAAIALPNFSVSLRNNRVGTQTNDLLSALNYARSEAVTRSRRVSICAADTTTGSTPTGCAAATAWSSGWMVFVDDTAGAAAPPAAVTSSNILRTWTGNPKNTLTAAQAFIRFDPRGQAVNPMDFTLKPASDCSGQQQRSISVSALGRAGSVKQTCT